MSACGVGTYKIESVQFCAVTSDTLVVATHFESGLSIERFGACPKVSYERLRFVGRVYVHRLSDIPDSPLRMADDSDVHAVLHSNSPALSSKDEDASHSIAFGLNVHCTPIQSFDASIATKEEMDALRQLGVDVGRIQYMADMPGGRWYLAFDPFKPGCKVACPSSSLVFESDATFDHGSIWDPCRGVLITMEEDPVTEIVGYPSQLRIWDYHQGGVNIFHLLSPY